MYVDRNNDIQRHCAEHLVSRAILQSNIVHGWYFEILLLSRLHIYSSLMSRFQNGRSESTGVSFLAIISTCCRQHQRVVRLADTGSFSYLKLPTLVLNLHFLRCRTVELFNTLISETLDNVWVMKLNQYANWCSSVACNKSLQTTWRPDAIYRPSLRTNSRTQIERISTQKSYDFCCCWDF